MEHIRKNKSFNDSNWKEEGLPHPGPYIVEVSGEAITGIEKDISTRLGEQSRIPREFLRLEADERLANLIEEGGRSQCYHRRPQPSFTDKVKGLLEAIGLRRK